MIRQWVTALAVVVVAVLMALGYQRYGSSEAAVAKGERPPTPVHTVLPHMETVRDAVNAVGSLKAVDAVALTTEVSGRVVEIHLKAGQRVRKGDLLLRLDDRQARADLAEIEAQLADARRQLARASQLRSNNSIAESQVDALKTAVDVALAQRQAARVRLDNLTLKAPFDGVVGLSDLSPGAYLTAGTPITTLDNTDRLELNFAIPERFLGQVAAGQAVRGTSPAYPDRTFTGALAELDTRVSELSRSLSVRALIDNRDHALRPGQFMSASLTLNERRALVVPEQAVLVRGDESYVFVAGDGVADRRSVALGVREPGIVEVVSGLSEDEPVVVTGQDRLSSGQRISVKDDENVLPDNRFAPPSES
ncbi:efflux RND transporter periplasmic adaptor subunit [Marinobacter sp. C2H3]|uniref:efflux RND transporter periplasmic adaptor subunit n=1 Tax=Marinobacter sp. C2H3 TaxID=3119003 RepID=UPI00300EF670